MWRQMTKEIVGGSVDEDGYIDRERWREREKDYPVRIPSCGQKGTAE